MQPYFYPYMGYFQLIDAVDLLVVYDDVQYIQRGWINRNYLLVKEGRQYFTIPVKKPKLQSLIKDVRVLEGVVWKKKIIRSFELNYSKAPNFNTGFEMLNQVLGIKSDFLIDYCLSSIQSITSYLDMNIEFQYSSELSYTGEDKIEKLNSIITIENAQMIVLPPGSLTLYDPSDFIKQAGFLNSYENTAYKQFHKSHFEKNLSILDMVMFCSKPDIISLLKKYTLRNNGLV